MQSTLLALPNFGFRCPWFSRVASRHSNLADLSAIPRSLDTKTLSADNDLIFGAG